MKSPEQAARELCGRIAKAELVVSFVEAEGTLPMAKKASGSVEAQAHKALARLRLLARRSDLETEVCAVLDAACPGWLDGNTFRLERAWRARRDELVQWMNSSQRPPYRAARDEAERGLAAFVATYRRPVQRRRFPERIKELDVLAPGWDATPAWEPPPAPRGGLGPGWFSFRSSC